jgi:hypothetical protein
MEVVQISELVEEISLKILRENYYAFLQLKNINHTFQEVILFHERQIKKIISTLTLLNTGPIRAAEGHFLYTWYLSLDFRKIYGLNNVYFNIITTRNREIAYMVNAHGLDGSQINKNDLSLLIMHQLKMDRGNLSLLNHQNGIVNDRFVNYTVHSIKFKLSNKEKYELTITTKELEQKLLDDKDNVRKWHTDFQYINIFGDDYLEKYNVLLNYYIINKYYDSNTIIKVPRIQSVFSTY